MFQVDLILVEKFKRVRVADVVDALDRYGYHDRILISREIRPLYSGIRIAGHALTVQTRKAIEEIPSMAPEEWEKFAGEWYSKKANYELFMKHAGPGIVITVNAAECPDVGFWGSNVSLQAKAKGVEGVVIDGGCRDTWEIQLLKIPVFCKTRGRTEVIGRLEIPPDGVNIPVTIGGVTVYPGDIVVGDDDGLVVVPKIIAGKVAERAEKQLEADRASQKPFLEKLGLRLI